MKRLLISTFLLIALPATGFAITCTESQSLLNELTKAQTKHEVTTILLRAGAPRNAAEALEKSSPDVEVARSQAKTALQKLSVKVCTEEKRKN